MQGINYLYILEFLLILVYVRPLKTVNVFVPIQSLFNNHIR